MQQFTLFVCIFVLFVSPSAGRTEENKLSNPNSTHEKMQVLDALRGVIDDSNIQEELQISEAQLKEMGKVIGVVQRGQQRASFEMMKLRLAPPDASPEEMRESIVIRQTKMREIMSFYDDAFDSLSDLLLPHQFKRLRQISRQANLRRFENKGFSGILYAPVQLRESIGVEESEIADLQSSISKIEIEYRRKLADLKEETFQAVLDELNAGQRTKTETLIGPLFDFEESERIERESQREKLMEMRHQAKRDATTSIESSTKD